MFKGRGDHLRLPDIAHGDPVAGDRPDLGQGLRLLLQRPTLNHVQAVAVDSDAPAAKAGEDREQFGLQVVHAPEVLLINLPLLTAEDVQRQARVLLRVLPDKLGREHPHVLLRVNPIIDRGGTQQGFVLAVEAPPLRDSLHAVAVVEFADQRVSNLDVTEVADPLELDAVTGEEVQVIREVGPHEVAGEHLCLGAEVGQHALQREVAPAFVSDGQVPARAVLDCEADAGDVAVRATARPRPEFAQVRVPRLAVNGDPLGPLPRGEGVEVRGHPVAGDGREQGWLEV